MSSIEEDISLGEYKKAYREIRAEEERKGFLIHLSIYIVVNVILIIINLVYSPETLWFFYPLIGWGIGIVGHYQLAVRKIEETLEKRENKAGRKIKKRRRDRTIQKSLGIGKTPPNSRNFPFVIKVSSNP